MQYKELFILVSIGEWLLRCNDSYSQYLGRHPPTLQKNRNNSLLWWKINQPLANEIRFFEKKFVWCMRGESENGPL